MESTIPRTLLISSCIIGLIIFLGEPKSLEFCLENYRRLKLKLITNLQRDFHILTNLKVDMEVVNHEKQKTLLASKKLK
jgi:hypothetical protein